MHCYYCELERGPGSIRYGIRQALAFALTVGRVSACSTRTVTRQGGRSGAQSIPGLT